MTERRQPPRGAASGGRFGPPPGGSPRGSDVPRRRVPAAPQPRGAQPRGAQPRGAQPRGAQPRGAQPRGAQPRAAHPRAAQPRPAAPRSRRPAGPPPRRPARPARRPRFALGALDGRLRYGFAAVCTLLLVVGCRLVQLQGLDHTNYAGAAAAQRVDTVALHALRGSILDRFGTPMAFTSDAQDITADPAQIPNDRRLYYAQRLSPLLGVSAARLVTLISGSSEYALLATALSPADAQRVMALNLLGIYEQATTTREYPGRTTGANVVGTVHADGTGAAGIEHEFNDVLAGKDGTMTYAVDNTGNVNPSSRTATVPAVNGSTVRLTLDQNLQFTAQAYLDQAVPEANARGAELAVLDVHTGQVLALASSGTFDASNPNTINPNVPIDPPVMSAFEPGSVQKAITFAAALQEGLITPQSVFNVPDNIQMGGVTVRDAWSHKPEKFTATGILAESSNVGTLKIAQKIGPTNWYRYEKLFGVGIKTGIELPGESSGYVPPIKDWSPSTFANLPFGQGESMTVLQLASIYQAIADNGVRVPPRIVQSVTSPDGAVHATAQPKGTRIVSPPTAQTLRTMLESVIMPGGTGIKAGIPGYRVAGKTGTAQQPDPAHGGAYSSYKNWDTFAGMIPADNPQFVVAIMVDNPAHGVEGGDVAAPLFHHIAAYEVQHARIAPTGTAGRHVPLQVCAGQNRAFLPANVC